MFHHDWKVRLRLQIALAFLMLAGMTVTGLLFAAPAFGQASGHKLHVVHMVMKNYMFTFEPETLTVDAGDTVEWVNDDIYVHNAVSDDHKTFHSPDLAPKKSWRYTADRKGTFPYYCTLHPNMKGTLIVK